MKTNTILAAFALAFSTMGAVGTASAGGIMSGMGEIGGGILQDRPLWSVAGQYGVVGRLTPVNEQEQMIKLQQERIGQLEKNAEK